MDGVQTKGAIKLREPTLSGSILGRTLVMEGNVSPLRKTGGNLSSLGIRGYSAYEVAVKHGYSGTEEEWLEDLKGEKIEIEVLSNWEIERDFQF